MAVLYLLISEKLWSQPYSCHHLKNNTVSSKKFDELMALCDHLKQRLTQASNTRCQLAETVMEGALKG